MGYQVFSLTMGHFDIHFSNRTTLDLSAQLTAVFKILKYMKNENHIRICNQIKKLQFMPGKDKFALFYLNSQLYVLSDLEIISQIILTNDTFSS